MPRCVTNSAFDTITDTLKVAPLDPLKSNLDVERAWNVCGVGTSGALSGLENLILAGKAFPSRLTARSDRLPDSRPRDFTLPQKIDCSLQLILGLLQPGRIDAKLIEEDFRHFAIGPDREFTGLWFRLKNLIAKPDALVADEYPRTGDEPAHLVSSLSAKEQRQNRRRIASGGSFLLNILAVRLP